MGFFAAYLDVGAHCWQVALTAGELHEGGADHVGVRRLIIVVFVFVAA